MDVLGKIALQSLPLFTDQTHVIVVKAGGMGTAKIQETEGLAGIVLNGEPLILAEGQYTFPYARGETITLELIPKEGYTLGDLSSGSGYEIEKVGDGYSITFSGESALQSAEIEWDLTSEKIQPSEGGNHTEEPQNHVGLIVGLSVGAVVLVAAGIVTFGIVKKEKIPDMFEMYQEKRFAPIKNTALASSLTLATLERHIIQLPITMERRKMQNLRHAIKRRSRSKT